MGSNKVLLLCAMIGLALFSTNIHVSEALELVVGGKESSWGIPTAPNALNGWAERERFKIGDVLVFKYNPKADSVLQVEEGDYKKCIKTKPINKYNDGLTKIKLVESGVFYFISGVNGNCQKGEKLEVKVLSHKHGAISSPAPSLPPKDSSNVLPPPPAEAPKANSAGSMAIGVSALVMTTLVAAVWLK